MTCPGQRPLTGRTAYAGICHVKSPTHPMVAPGIRGGSAGADSGFMTRSWVARYYGTRRAGLARIRIPPISTRRRDSCVTAVQVMNTAIATNWHVAAAHTKAWKTS